MSGRSPVLHPDLTIYFDRYAAGPALLPPSETPPRLVVTIPAHREPNISATIDSLLACEYNSPTEIIVLLNHGEQALPEVKEKHTLEAQTLMERYKNTSIPNLSLHFLVQSLPEKHAGVGMARKILMDEAARRLDPESGIIVALDADCTVDNSYITEIEKYFNKNPGVEGASIWFEHPLPDEEHLRSAIITYELHLRYFVEAQRMLNLPYAYHTVGSSMAVRPTAYCKAGGMNRRKAGEDFYFLHKIIPRGFGEINTTTVYPSGRRSDRVPFGTGRAVEDLISGKREATTYAPDNFIILKKLIDRIFYSKLIINDLNTIEKSLLEYLNFQENLDRIQRQSSSAPAFKKHFYAWFDGFQLMKAIHFLRDHHQGDVPVATAASWLLEEFYNAHSSEDEFELLSRYRNLQRII